MNTKLTTLINKLRARARASRAQEDALHPKRDWYTMVGLATLLALIGGVVGLFEYHRTHAVLSDERASTPSVSSVDDRALEEVLQLHRARSKEFLKLRGESAAPSVRPVDVDEASPSVPPEADAAVEANDVDVYEEGRVEATY